MVVDKELGKEKMDVRTEDKSCCRKVYTIHVDEEEGRRKGNTREQRDRERKRHTLECVSLIYVKVKKRFDIINFTLDMSWGHVVYVVL